LYFDGAIYLSSVFNPDKINLAEINESLVNLDEYIAEIESDHD